MMYEEVSVQRGFKEELMPIIKSVLRAAESNRIDLSYWINWSDEDLKGGYFTRPKMKGGDLYTLKIYKDERGWYRLYLENLYEKCRVYDEDGNWSYDDDKWDQLFEEDPVEEDEYEDYEEEPDYTLVGMAADLMPILKSIHRYGKKGYIGLTFDRPILREGDTYNISIYIDDRGGSQYIPPIYQYKFIH